MKYQMKNYEKEDFLGVSKLFFNTFHKEWKEEEFVWKNENNPQGKSIAKVAMEKGNIVGFSSLWQFQMQLFSDIVKGSQSVDAMVSKEYRKQGIFESLAMEAIQEVKEQGGEIRFNFPNEAAYQASLSKIQIQKVCDIPQYIKILNSSEAVKLFSQNKGIQLAGKVAFSLYNRFKKLSLRKVRKYDIKEIHQFDERFDRLWARVRKEYPIAVIRGREYLAWRYQNREKYKILCAYQNKELLGYLVLAVEEKQAKDESILKMGHIADVVVLQEEKEAFIQLLLEGEKNLKQQGACGISCWMMKNWFYGELFSKNGYLQLRSPSVLAVLPVGEKAEMQKEALLEPSNWFVTIGDSDYI